MLGVERGRGARWRNYVFSKFRSRGGIPDRAWCLKIIPFDVKHISDTQKPNRFGGKSSYNGIVNKRQSKRASYRRETVEAF